MKEEEVWGSMVVPLPPCQACMSAVSIYAPFFFFLLLMGLQAQHFFVSKALSAETENAGPVWSIFCLFTLFFIFK